MKPWVLIGGGPSLTVEDVEFVRFRAHVIAINDAYKLAPWAEVLYAADRSWIDAHDGVSSFKGRKYSIDSKDPTDRPDWTVLRNTGPLGLEHDPMGLRAGFNSGYQAVNLAVHLGAKRIILLGYDMGIDGNGSEHWFPDPPDRRPSPYAEMCKAFSSLVGPLAMLDVLVLNCSRRSALTAFTRASLTDALACEAVEPDTELRISQLRARLRAVESVLTYLHDSLSNEPELIRLIESVLPTEKRTVRVIFSREHLA